jgi:hypothetical protein
MTMDTAGERRWALIVGHPGHELRVWSWLCATRPLVAVLTDGSGSGGQARLALTREVCLQAEARISGCFGVATDRELYAAMLAGNIDFFLGLSEQLAATLLEERIDAVAGDAIEGYNPTHDVCRFIIDRAVRLVRRERPLTNYAFAIVGSAKPSGQEGALVMPLSPEEVDTKLRVCRRYAEAAGGTLFGEVAAMLREFDAEEFAFEHLVPADGTRPADSCRPFYETYGEQQAAAGRYDVVIRREQHIVPIERALDA